MRVLQAGSHNVIFLRGKWIAQAGFINGMPIKIWVIRYHYPEHPRVVRLRRGPIFPLQSFPCWVNNVS
ncbi:SymE family type I addiction module toxin [Salmonella enterica]|uniref:SymE family type I addiction module toxin n=1 Tax=Salmonella enterica TaxID=28901 RepID=UPI0034CD8DB7